MRGTVGIQGTSAGKPKLPGRPASEGNGKGSLPGRIRIPLPFPKVKRGGSGKKRRTAPVVAKKKGGAGHFLHETFEDLTPSAGPFPESPWNHSHGTFLLHVRNGLFQGESVRDLGNGRQCQDLQPFRRNDLTTRYEEQVRSVHLFYPKGFLFQRSEYLIITGLCVPNPVVPFYCIFLYPLKHPLPASFREQENGNVRAVASGVSGNLQAIGECGVEKSREIEAGVNVNVGVNHQQGRVAGWRLDNLYLLFRNLAGPTWPRAPGGRF